MSNGAELEAGIDFRAGKDHDSHVRIEQTRQLFEHVGVGLLVTLVNAGILAYAVRGDVDRSYLLGWFGTILIVVACRAALLFAYRQASDDERSDHKWKLYFDAGALVMGLAWGASAVFAFSETNVATQMFLGFVLGGMAAGAVSTLSIDYRTYLLYLVPSLVPFIVRLFWAGTEAHISMGVMAALFFVVLLMSGRRYNRALKSSLELRHANDDLIEELRSAIKAADEASRSKSLFLANMSHEIRTPMNGVFGMTDLLKRTALSTRQLRLVDTIHQSAKTLLTIINDILDLSRIEAGKLELDKTDFDLRHCIEGAGELFAEEAERKGLELTVFVGNDVPEFAKGDGGRLRQILVNLIGNAVKFTERGDVSIKAECVGDRVASARDLVITVRDSGIGIDEASLKRIEEPFSQADSSISRRFGGTGLGLSISKHLIAMMDGKMSLESRLGEGTVIRVVIPVERGEGEVVCSRPDCDRLDGRRVLVVDDRDTNREIFKCYLEEGGAVVTLASGAAAALEILNGNDLEAGGFDAAILDGIMPGMNGLELAKVIRSDVRLSKLPLVMVTSLSWKGDSKVARQVGIDEFMTKPIRRRDVIAAVNRALSMDRGAFRNKPMMDTQPTQLKGHILVAEDNPVNREVVIEFVASFGCTAEVVENGIDAVQAYRSSQYDMILMDCQMPEMDGFTATRKIRAIEEAEGLARIPIVALTANAFEGDRQACLDAGMDGYVSKPFTETELEKAMAQWLEVLDSSDPDTGCIDSEHFAQLGSKKPDLLVRMIEVFMKHAPQTLQGMQNGLLEEDPVKIALNAHSLKSSSANLGARRLSELCKVVEFEAKTKAAAELALLVEKVHQEFELAVRTLQVKASLIGCRPGNVEAVGLPEKRAGAGARSY